MHVTQIQSQNNETGSRDKIYFVNIIGMFRTGNSPSANSITIKAIKFTLMLQNANDKIYFLYSVMLQLTNTKQILQLFSISDIEESIHSRASRFHSQYDTAPPHEMVSSAIEVQVQLRTVTSDRRATLLQITEKFNAEVPSNIAFGQCNVPFLLWGTGADGPLGFHC